MGFHPSLFANNRYLRSTTILLTLIAFLQLLHFTSLDLSVICVFPCLLAGAGIAMLAARYGAREWNGNGMLLFDDGKRKATVHVIII